MAAPHYAFVGWTSSNGGSFGNANNSSTTFTMPVSGTTVTANFIYTLPTPVNPGVNLNGGGFGDGEKEKKSRESIEEIEITDAGKTSASTTPLPLYTATMNNGTVASNIEIQVNYKTGTAEVKIGTQEGEVISKGGHVDINVPSIQGISHYRLGLPLEFLKHSGGKGTLAFHSDVASVTLPAHMFAGLALGNGKNLEVDLSQTKGLTLSDKLQASIGNRPLVQLSLIIDNQKVEWQNSKSYVGVELPYTPTSAELKKGESLLVWYIDPNGNGVSIPSGRYVPEKKALTFTVKHLSQFGVGYNPLSFTDVNFDRTDQEAISFITARGIATGTGKGRFNPDGKLTRGQCSVMLMKAYGIEANVTAGENFLDAGNTYYTPYLMAGKQLGIASGVGNNRFAPEQLLTRADLYSFLYKTLKVLEALPEDSAMIDLKSIPNPKGIATRGEMAELLYQLLAR